MSLIWVSNRVRQTLLSVLEREQVRKNPYMHRIVIEFRCWRICIYIDKNSVCIDYFVGSLLAGVASGVLVSTATLGYYLITN